MDIEEHDIKNPSIRLCKFWKGNERKEAYFHKFIDNPNPNTHETKAMAVVEYVDGSVDIVSLNIFEFIDKP